MGATKTITSKPKTKVDEHHHEHHDESFITKYIFSEDHKIIAKQFLITGIFWAIIGGAMSSLFRIQLGFPDMDLTALSPIIGNWLTPQGKIDPEVYLALITMHGTIMVFFVLTAGLSGTFSNYLIPLQIGARDMASGFLNMLSYWFFFLSSIVMFISIFVEGGPASGGWTIYPPLSALPQAVSGSGMGMTLWLVSMSLFIVSALLGALNYITTVINLRTEGMTFFRMPLTIWAFFVTAILGVLSFPVLLSAALLLIMDRSFGTSFYLSDIYIAGEALANQGGSAILFQHLFWFLGHPEVYIVILPSLGITSEIIATCSRKPIFGYRAMVYSIFGIGVLSFVVWAHHMFTVGMPLAGEIFFMLTTMLIAVPTGVKVFNWVATMWKGSMTFETPMLFSLAFIILFTIGGFSGLMLAMTPADFQYHDTYFVVAHFHYVLVPGAVFAIIAAVYYWLPKWTGKMYSESLGKLHFWLTTIFVNLTFFPMHFVGLAGMPRRIPDYPVQFADFNAIASVGAFGFGLSQLLFVYILYNTLKKDVTVDDKAWDGAEGLEWTISSPPPYHSFEKAPKVD